MAVIFMSVMLAFSLLLGSIAYKQAVLSGAALESQTAFYAADAAQECALRVDQNPTGSMFPSDYNGASAPSFQCDGQSPEGVPTVTSIGSEATAAKVFSYRFQLHTNPATGQTTHCADVDVYKYAQPQGSVPNTIVAYIFSRGYSTSCGSIGGAAHYAVRGLHTHY